MTQLTAPSSAAVGGNDGWGALQKIFDTQRIPKLQPLAGEPDASTTNQQKTLTEHAETRGEDALRLLRVSVEMIENDAG